MYEGATKQVCDLLVKSVKFLGKILLFVNENWEFLLVKGWCSDGKLDEAEKDGKRDKSIINKENFWREEKLIKEHKRTT